MDNKLKLLIVEDDPLIAIDVKGIVEDAGHNVAGVFHSVEDAKSALPLDFDLALLDINLEEERVGIELGIHLREKHKKPCIFITSYYDQETVELAKNAQPLAYILKPYEEQHILTNLELSRMRLKQRSKISEDAPLFVKASGKLTKIVPSKVSVVQAYDMYTHLFVEGKRITASQTLKEIEQLFGDLNFIRVHRSYMVNIDAIEGICEDEILIGEQRIPVGRTYKKELFDRITTI